jgi:signal transduction histidine kinase
MQIRRSLRWRVAAGVALFTILVVTVHASILFVATQNQEKRFIEHYVAHEMQEVVETYGRNPNFKPSQVFEFRIFILPSGTSWTSLPQYLRPLGIGVHHVHGDDVDWHVQVLDNDGVRFIVAYDVHFHDVRLHEFAALLVLSVATAALVSLWLGYWLAGMLTRPVSALAQRVSSLKQGPPLPLAKSFGDEEVQSLAAAFDGYVSRLNETLLREREFTANVSHELRSPLQALRTACELLVQDPALSGASRDRVLRTQRVVERMAAIVQALLFLARVEERADVEDIGLRDCVDEVVEPLRERIAGKAISLDVDIEPRARVRANRTALYMVLANLVRNAIDYTDAGRVRVQQRGERVVVEDSGCGIPEAELPKIFDRFYRANKGADGFGVGLAIVKQLCDRYGWELAVQSTAGTGTRITLDFAPANSH